MTRPHLVLCITLGAIVAMALFDSLVLWSTTHASSVDLVSGVVLAACAFAWVTAGARERKIGSRGGSALLAALIIPVGIPVYLFRTRGFRRGFLSSLKAFGFMAIAIAIYMCLALCIELLGWSAYVA
jgi:hypothetical protein